MYTSQQLLGSCGKCRRVYHTWILQGFWNINSRKSPLALSNMDEFVRIIAVEPSPFLLRIPAICDEYICKVYPPPTQDAIEAAMPAAKNVATTNKSKKSPTVGPTFHGPRKNSLGI